MATSKPITLQVSDIVKWFRNKELVVNDTFQRHSVWTSAAQTYLIDTLLNELPVPKIYLRTTIEPRTQSAIREIVDGQQRIRTIVAFADNKLVLSNRSAAFAGKRYQDLDPEEQGRFLGYTITVEQLLNATDDDVIDIFARLNSYTVSLNAAEKRHAAFQTNFKFAVRAASQDLRWFIEKYQVFTTKLRFRMADDVLMAEIFGVLLEGVRDGGERNITKLYTRQDDDVFTEAVAKKMRVKMEATVAYLDLELGAAMKGYFSRHYHILMLAAAYAHHKFCIPAGDIDKMPARGHLAASQVVLDRLARLEQALDSGEPAAKYKAFVEASASSTHRIGSRKVRFLQFAAILAE